MDKREPIAALFKSALDPAAALLRWYGLKTAEMSNTRYLFGEGRQGEYVRASKKECPDE
jgi:hypothetical protein